MVEAVAVQEAGDQLNSDSTKQELIEAKFQIKEKFAEFAHHDPISEQEEIKEQDSWSEFSQKAAQVKEDSE